MGKNIYIYNMNRLPAQLDDNDLKILEESARQYARRSLSDNTRRGYASDWSDFQFWCKRVNKKALPASPDTVALYLTKMSRHLKVSSLKRRVTAIKKAHEFSDLTSPTSDPRVKSVLRGIVVSNGEQQNHASPTLLNHIKLMLKALPDTSRGVRDRCLLLLGFAGGLRRSEIVNLNFEDLTLSKDGLVLNIRRSKTDQTSRGRKIAIKFGQDRSTCPITALESWIERLGKAKGHVFCAIDRWGYLSPNRLTDQSVRLIVKESLKRAKISEKNFSGHSLRAGFATVAAINGASERDIQRTTGHVSLEVLRRYIRDGEIFRNNASDKLGL